MVNQNRLPSDDGFYDSDTPIGGLRLNHSNGFLPPSPSESPQKLDSNHAAFDAGQETSSMLKTGKKRKATTLPSSTPDPKRVWSKDEELVILKGIVDYRNETGVDYLSDSAAFFDYIKDDIASKSKDQLVNKLRKLKSKFRDNLRRKPSFTNSIDSQTFDLSMAVWGKDKAQCVGGSMEKAKVTRSKLRAPVEHEAVTNGEPQNDDGSAKTDSFDKLSSEHADKNMEKETAGGKEIEEVEGVTNGETGNDDGSAKGDSFDKLPSENVDKDMEIETGGKESEEVEAVTNVGPGNDDGSAKGDSCGKLPYENVDKRMEKENEEDGADDELCALQDALETTMFQHLGIYAQKLMLEKLRSLRAEERKELCGEWKSLLYQEALLKSKKHSFTAKLANAALHD